MLCKAFERGFCTVAPKVGVPASCFPVLCSAVVSWLVGAWFCCLFLGVCWWAGCLVLSSGAVFWCWCPCPAAWPVALSLGALVWFPVVFCLLWCVLWCCASVWCCAWCSAVCFALLIALVFCLPFKISCKTRKNGFPFFENESKLYTTQLTRRQQDHDQLCELHVSRRPPWRRC